MKQYNSYQNPQVLQKSNSAILAYKPIAFTPLETIKFIQQKFPEYKNEKLGYAGRLDPMAEGLLLLLIGDENREKAKYEQLNKEYRFKCTFGIKTDTLDILGIITAYDNRYIASDTFLAQLKNKLSTLQGNISLQYPIYSAKRVRGKPLYYWARRNKLNEITRPSAYVTIYSIKLNKLFQNTGEKIATESITKIKKVKGDFRQDKIINSWLNFKKTNKDNMFLTADITAQVSSGTYVRSICEKLGEQLGTCAIATHIKRTAIGEYR